MKIKDFLPYYFLTVICSSISYAIFIVIIDPGYRAIIAFIVIPFVALIPYLIAGVPIQIFLNKRPKKFNILYLLIYLVVAIAFLYLSYKLQGDISDPIMDYNTMFIWAIGASVIYWFWDSVIMQKDEYPYY
ncbi:hypothetical protein GFV16_11335 [Bacillus megaterium]|uniref:UPF0715 family protein n=1 Tax=Priestia megaterium TaxID=1404 RepID=UPI001293A8CE|nr:UPF0715 family protein [Priestia megaterium]MQR86504.1 hypothetical protein [Priestia megaterium]